MLAQIKKQLEQILSQAIKDEDSELVNWLLAHGIADTEGKVEAIRKAAYEKTLAKLGEREAVAPAPAQEIEEEQITEIVNPISNTPVRIRQLVPRTETVKEFSVTPLYSVSYEETAVRRPRVLKPFAKPAPAKPVPVKLTPFAKPAPAAPNSRASFLKAPKPANLQPVHRLLCRSKNQLH